MLKEIDRVRKKYQENRNKPFKSWLNYENIFPNQGKQGIVGTMTTKDKSNSVVFKISQDINYGIEHESIVMESLNDISGYNPHFCKSIGMIEAAVEPKYKKDQNPFSIKSKYPVRKKLLLMEYLKNCYKLYNYIKSDISEDILYSTIKQVILSLIIAQNKLHFTHYDLHSCNVIMKKCSKDLVIMYRIDEDNAYVVPTYGYYPVIIDYGFSYVKNMQNGPLYPSLGHTKVGFNSFTYDMFSDAKLFLVTVADEIFEKRHSKESKKLKRVVYNMFKRLKIDWKSGWDGFENESASDYIGRLIKSFDVKSKLFDEYEFYCIDLIQSLIILPLERRSYSNMEKAYRSFIKEWNKIESNIASVYYNLYILKSIVNCARLVRADYLSLNTRDKAVKEFKRSVYSVIDEVTSFCNPKSINFEILLCSLYVLANSFEGIFFDITQSTLLKKNEYYDDLPFESMEDIYKILEVNIPSKCSFDKSTKLLILDGIREKTRVYDFSELDEESISFLNDYDNIIRGFILDDIIKK